MLRRAPLLLLLAAVGCSGGETDFYAIPGDVAEGANGRLLRLQEIDPLAPDSRAFRVLYRSTGIHGEPIAVSGLVAVPDAAPPSDGYDVVAWAHGTTGIADACAPSTGRRFNHDAYDVAPEVLAEGWILVATDYEGLGTEGVHRYLIGDSEARSILDSVRAVAGIEGVAISSDVVLWGRSQGGHACLFAGELAPTYAPELHVRGTVIGAPASNLAAAFPLSGLLGANGGAYNWLMGFAFADAFGFDVATIYDPTILTQVRAALDDGACLSELATLATSLDGAGLDTVAVASLALDDELKANSPGGRPQSAPVRIHQGLEDGDVPAAVTAMLVDRMCANGDGVEYVEYPGENHPQSTAAHEAEMVAFTRARFAAEAFVSNCP